MVDITVKIIHSTLSPNQTAESGIFLYILPYILPMITAREGPNGRDQLLFANGIERGIQDRQFLKYQPSVTSRMIFHH